MKRRRALADALPSLLGEMFCVPNRSGTAGNYFGALDAREYARRVAMRTLPPTPTRRVDAGQVRRDTERVLLLCRCESKLIPVSRSVAESGQRPTCGLGCAPLAKRLKNPLRVCRNCLTPIEQCGVHHTPRGLCDGWHHWPSDRHVCGVEADDAGAHYTLAAPIEWDGEA